MSNTEWAGWIFLTVLAAGALTWLIVWTWLDERKNQQFWRDIQQKAGVRPNRRR